MYHPEGLTMTHTVDKETALARRLWAITTNTEEGHNAVTGALSEGAQSTTETTEIFVKDGKGNVCKIQAYTIDNITRQRLLALQSKPEFRVIFYWKNHNGDDIWVMWKKGKTVGKEAAARLIRSSQEGKRIDFADRLNKRGLPISKKTKPSTATKK
jgi:hypothetical protein